MKDILKFHRLYCALVFYTVFTFYAIAQPDASAATGFDNSANTIRAANDEVSSIFESPIHLLQFFGDYSGRSTNFLRDKYNGGSTWNELRVLFPKLSSAKGSLPTPYFSALLKAQRDINWEDRLDFGVGIEWRPLKNYGYLRLFSAYFTTVFLNYEEAWDWRPRNDFRLGMELYNSNLYKESIKEKNNPIFYEIWSELSYRTSNFFIDDFDTWFLGFVPRVGLKIPESSQFFCIPYLTGEFTLTGKLPHINNSNFWTNRILLGAGIKLLPFQDLKSNKLHFLLNRIHFYGEVLVVTKYLRTAPSNVPFKDWRFGVAYLINRAGL